MTKENIWEIFDVSKEEFDKVVTRAFNIAKESESRFEALEKVMSIYKGKKQLVAISVVEHYYGYLAAMEQIFGGIPVVISDEDREVF